jgi:hypothetical protein
MTVKDLELGPKAILSFHCCLNENFKKLEKIIKAYQESNFLEDDDENLLEPIRQICFDNECPKYKFNKK